MCNTPYLRYKGTALDCMVWPAEAAALLGIMPVKVPVDTSRIILSPMPGVVKLVSVSVGDMVGDGQECAVVEAMKMQNSLASGVTGVVKVEKKFVCNEVSLSFAGCPCEARGHRGGGAGLGGDRVGGDDWVDHRPAFRYRYIQRDK